MSRPEGSFAIRPNGGELGRVVAFMAGCSDEGAKFCRMAGEPVDGQIQTLR